MNYDLSNIAVTPHLGFWWEVDGETHLNPLTQGILYASTLVDMGEITEQNCAEFYARTHLVEVLGGVLYRGLTDQAVGISLGDVRNHIGLTTDVVTRARREWVTGLLSRRPEFPKHDPTMEKK